MTVYCSKRKLPVSVTAPAMARRTPVPLTCSSGPAGRVSVAVVPPTVNVWLTAVVPVFSVSPKVPATDRPGTLTATVADS